MITNRDFYKYYQTDFFKIQQLINEDVLENIEEWQKRLKPKLVGSENTDLAKLVKSNIRITYLHCIDTLFELIFGLYPREGKILDQELAITIAKNNDEFNKKRIAGLAEGNENMLEEISRPITFRSTTIPLLQYIIFYQIEKESIVEGSGYQNIVNSIGPVLELLIMYAKDLADKSEYNSLKHGLRIYPFSGFFQIRERNSQKPIAGIDFIDALQYMFETKEEYIIVTKNFDCKRDIRLTILASKMIWNIIKIRDAMMSNEIGQGSCYVNFFDKSEYEDFDKTYTHRQQTKLKIKKNGP